MHLCSVERKEKRKVEDKGKLIIQRSFYIQNRDGKHQQILQFEKSNAELKGYRKM